MRLAALPWSPPLLSVVGPFYDDPAFLDAFAAQGAPLVKSEKPDCVLFSFHGLPERHVRKSDASGKHCLASKRLLLDPGFRKSRLLPRAVLRHGESSGRATGPFRWLPGA